MITSILVLSTLLFLFSAIRRIIAKSQQHDLPLPPGPKGLPILGNVLDIKQRKDRPRWEVYRNWSTQYGSDISANELLEKRSGNYSDRPPMYMVNDLMKWDWDFVHMRYSDQWRRVANYFQIRNASQFHEVQKAASLSLLQKLAASPDDYYNHVRGHAGSIILKLVYGYTLQEDDPYIELAAKAMEGLIAAVNHGSFLVDFLPILKHVPSWLPGASFKRKAKAWVADSIAIKERPWEWFAMAMGKGTASPSFASRTLEKNIDNPEMIDVIKNSSAIAYLAGSDTTVSLILSFILAMVLHPEIQARAQAEIDAVVGSTRLPDFDDREKLPYIEAILAESLRWHPVAPLAIPHRSIKDDVYGNLYIPAGTTIVANAWAIMHDDAIYPDPSAFNPERFVKQEGKELPPHPEQFAFGFGRRVCPGKHVASSSAWLAMVYLLSTFSMARALDGNGKEIDPEINYNDGLVRPLWYSSGNVWDIGPVRGEPRWRRYHSWSSQYDSDAVYIEVCGDPMIILNSREAVVKLLAKCSSYYSDRSRMMYMANDLSGTHWDTSRMRYPDWWSVVK
uniref:Putative cytochrome P450 n=1 Tax=Moniliophthora roreri TaxID=221103 RepID=A0A0W0FRH2_MONRR